jgi:hypothetical protein
MGLEHVMNQMFNTQGAFIQLPREMMSTVQTALETEYDSEDGIEIEQIDDSKLHLSNYIESDTQAISSSIKSKMHSDSEMILDDSQNDKDSVQNIVQEIDANNEATQCDNHNVEMVDDNLQNEVDMQRSSKVIERELKIEAITKDELAEGSIFDLNEEPRSINDVD